MNAIKTLRDEWAMVFASQLIAADLQYQAMMQAAKEQGLAVTVKGRPVADIVTMAYSAADTALEIRSRMSAPGQ
jgi:hypothetical protein